MYPTPFASPAAEGSYSWFCLKDKFLLQMFWDLFPSGVTPSEGHLGARRSECNKIEVRTATDSCTKVVLRN